MLPKISYPIFSVSVPSTKAKVSFRPFLVKEEKLLLIAREADNRQEILRTIKQVVNNCSLDDTFKVDSLSIFDLEYLFIKIRASSVSNIAKVAYIDNEDSKVYNFAINLDDIEVVFPPNISNKIEINKDMGIVMKYPSASLFDDKDFFDSGDEAFYQLIIRCIDKIYTMDEVYDPKNYSREEIDEFLDSVGIPVFTKIKEFLESVPTLYYKLEYKNSLGNAKTIELKSLSDFFTLG